MSRTVTVHGSDEVLVHVGGGVFGRGKPEMIKVTGLQPDESNLPMIVRQDLVGLEIRTIWSKDYLIAKGEDGLAEMFPDGGRAAFADEVIAALKEAGKKQAASELKKQAPNDGDMLVFHHGTYEVLSS